MKKHTRKHAPTTNGKIIRTIDHTGARQWRNGQGLLHREDGPAHVDTRGRLRKWYRHGELYRDDGPAVIDEVFGYEEWCQYDQHHRDDGPAYISRSFASFWCRHGKTHRIDGPAAIFVDGNEEWYVNDVQIDPQTIGDLGIDPSKWRIWTDAERAVVKLALEG